WAGLMGPPSGLFAVPGVSVSPAPALPALGSAAPPIASRVGLGRTRLSQRCRRAADRDGVAVLHSVEAVLAPADALRLLMLERGPVPADHGRGAAAALRRVGLQDHGAEHGALVVAEHHADELLRDGSAQRD